MKTKIFQIYLYVLSLMSLLWWPLSHWIYPDTYHRWLGFQSYPLSFVRVIGSLSFFPVLGMFFVARNPVRNRDFFISLLIISVLIIATYFHLIQTKQFPRLEYFNLILLLVNGALSSILYPWKETLKSVTY